MCGPINSFNSLVSGVEHHLTYLHLILWKTGFKVLEIQKGVIEVQRSDLIWHPERTMTFQLQNA